MGKQQEVQAGGMACAWPQPPADAPCARRNGEGGAAAEVLDRLGLRLEPPSHPVHPQAFLGVPQGQRQPGASRKPVGLGPLTVFQQVHRTTLDTWTGVRNQAHDLVSTKAFGAR